MNAIPTMYGGVQFRSRTEAAWAASMDIIGWPWKYEPLDLKGYIPDFILPWPRGPFLIEVKGKPVLAGLYQHTDKIDESGWTNGAAIVGPGQFNVDAGESYQPIIGIVSQHQPCESGWDAAVIFRCLACDQISILHAGGMWFCQRCGAYEGNHHIEWLPETWFEGVWREAKNKVQWRPET